ncbi:MAG: NAD(+) diphosphatase [Oleiphilaceae bacterium]|nr:NAD(+) diphosphatase [Oleiphilaceae bacterium]
MTQSARVGDWRRPGEEDDIVALSGSNILQPASGWFQRWSDVKNRLVAGSEPVFVGRFNDRDLFVVEVVSEDLRSEDQPIPLREALLSRPDAPAALIGTAVQIQHWWQDHRFCGRCGDQTIYHAVERTRWCENCEISWHARLAPCVIVVVRRDGRFLLARSSRTRRHYFSLIAGFVEPGESAEEAVRREVMEETGLSVINIRYQASQPWPFPHQLMLGYFADYDAGELILQEDELADADWFEPGNLPPVPPSTTIAGRLISAMESEIMTGRAAK